jgi:hypothetical protein
VSEQPRIQIIHDANAVKRPAAYGHLKEVWWQGRQWAVTDRGLERRDAGGNTPHIWSEFLADGLKEGGGPSQPISMAHEVHYPGSQLDFPDFITAWLIAIVLHDVVGSRMKLERVREEVELALQIAAGTPK